MFWALELSISQLSGMTHYHTRGALTDLSGRFGDLLNNLSLVVPESTYDRDPTMDYETYNTALYVMATCHSLRKVNNDLLGDPLDVKMFEFTHWTFEENIQLNDVSCSVARPPVGIGSSIYRNDTSTRVGLLLSTERTKGLSLTQHVESSFGTRYLQVIRICVTLAPSQRDCSEEWRIWW